MLYGNYRYNNNNNFRLNKIYMSVVVVGGTSFPKGTQNVEISV
jgi:hypothetical protein